jgi:hypothetical protein
MRQAFLLEGAMKLISIFASIITALYTPVALAANAAGDTLVYRVTNGYNKETVGHVRQELAPSGTAQGKVVNVAVDNPALGLPRVEVFEREGLWLRHTLDSHGMPVEYEFAPALPAVQAPFNTGHSWSTRVNAMVKLGGENLRRSVRVDGTVLGTERVRVPAGEFDAVKIRRIIYPGDPGFSRTETRIYEVDWYAPALGGSVRTETRSSWMEPCGRRYCEHRGDWFIYELAEALAATK